MLSGKELGDALTQAMALKKVGPTAVADAFGVKPPSVKDWQAFGRIHKKHLGRLVEYFRDVVPPEHWGMGPGEQTGSADLAKALGDWRLEASARSQAVIDQLTVLAKKNALRDEDWELIEQMAARFLKR